jgi:hypothetical protein
MGAIDRRDFLVRSGMAIGAGRCWPLTFLFPKPSLAHRL